MTYVQLKYHQVPSHCNWNFRTTVFFPSSWIFLKGSVGWVCYAYGAWVSIEPSSTDTLNAKSTELYFSDCDVFSRNPSHNHLALPMVSGCLNWHDYILRCLQKQRASVMSETHISFGDFAKCRLLTMLHLSMLLPSSIPTAMLPAFNWIRFTCLRLPPSHPPSEQTSDLWFIFTDAFPLGMCVQSWL